MRLARRCSFILLLGAATAARAASVRPSFEGDLRFGPQGPRTAGGPRLPPRPAAAPPQVVFLDFDGDRVKSALTDDATHDESAIATQPVSTIPPFDPTAYSGVTSRSVAISQILAFVQAKLGPYDILLTSSRPASGPYTMALVGGLPADLAQPDGVAGVALLDCDNQEPSNLVFVFAGALGSVADVEIDICHELGHSFGAAHTDNASDIMHSSLDPAQHDYLEGLNPDDSRCTDAPFQQSAAVLLDALGPSGARPDLGPPWLEIAFPPAGATVPASLVVSAESFDDSGVASVELLRDGAPLEEAVRPPWLLPDGSASAGPHTYEVRAKDLAGNVSNATVAVTVQPGAGTPAAACLSSSDCPGEGVCLGGVCVASRPGAYRAACEAGFNCLTNACDRANGLTGICTGACSAGSDCPSGVCEGGVCAEVAPGDLISGCDAAPASPGRRSATSLAVALTLLLALAALSRPGRVVAYSVALGRATRHRTGNEGRGDHPGGDRSLGAGRGATRGHRQPRSRRGRRYGRRRE